MLESILSVLRFTGIMLLVLLVFNFMILVHEWGHFLAARWRGLYVDRFYIWFGKPIWKKTWNGVEYGLGCVPLGGFVSIPQMAPMDAIEGKSDATGNREKLPPIKPLDKIIVAFAGPLFSALLGLAFACLVCIFGRPTQISETSTVIGGVVSDMPAAKAGLKPGDKILEIDGKKVERFMGLTHSIVWEIASNPNPTINFLIQRPGETGPITIPVSAPRDADPQYKKWQESAWHEKLFARPPTRKVGIGPELPPMKLKTIMPNGPAAQAGLEPGDVIVAVNGSHLYSLAYLFDIASGSAGQPIQLKVQRGDQMLEKTLVPRKPDEPSDYKHALTGIGEAEVLDPEARALAWKGGNPFLLVSDALRNSWATLTALVKKDSPISVQDLSGPVGIMNVYYNIMDNVFRNEHGWKLILWFSVILNLSLAVLNLMPLPVFDGGHILMALIEMVRKKAVSVQVMQYVQGACVLLILSFVVFITFKDAGQIARDNTEGKEIKFLPPAAAVPPAPGS